MRSISKERKDKISELENKIGYRFNKKYLLNRAMTHSSYANQYMLPYIEHNERLEFLGDSVLSLVISEFIFKKYRNKPEGKLTKIRANIVCETSLYQRAKRLGLGEYLLVGRGEEITGGRERVSILADAYEALIAAIYIDGGLDSAKMFIIPEFTDDIENVVDREYFKDYKSRLQEYVQKDQNAVVKYEVVGEEGPAHNKVFYVNVNINGNYAGKGQGKSKKEAEQQAAKAAFESLGKQE
jgi:ribonuclease-3